MQKLGKINCIIQWIYTSAFLAFTAVYFALPDVFDSLLSFNNEMSYLGSFLAVMTLFAFLGVVFFAVENLILAVVNQIMYVKNGTGIPSAFNYVILVAVILFAVIREAYIASCMFYVAFADKFNYIAFVIAVVALSGLARSICMIIYYISAVRQRRIGKARLAAA